jgi:hypothetical protein
MGFFLRVASVHGRREKHEICRGKGTVEDVIRRLAQIGADGDTWSTVKSIESDVI